MRFAELQALLRSPSLPEESERRLPPREQVRAIAEAVRAGLAGPQLAIDLLRMEIEARDGAAGIAPFHRVPGSGVRLAFAYWAPGRTAGPHDHSGWTVTAVFHNRLDVATFDWEAAVRSRRLVPKNLFSAEAGRAGYIFEPCIHDPRNPTKSWAISLHLLGPHDGPMLCDQVGPIEGLGASGLPAAPDGGSDQHDQDPLSLALAGHRRECVRRAQIAALAGRGAAALPLLKRLHDRGDGGTRLGAARAMGWSEPLHRRSPLHRGWRGVKLEVNRAGRAELLARSPRHSLCLLRTDDRAAPALEFLAGADRFRPEELPGADPAGQLTLARTLIDWGVFQPSDVLEK